MVCGVKVNSKSFNVNSFILTGGFFCLFVFLKSIIWSELPVMDFLMILMLFLHSGGSSEHPKFSVIVRNGWVT